MFEKKDFWDKMEIMDDFLCECKDIIQDENIIKLVEDKRQQYKDAFDNKVNAKIKEFTDLLGKFYCWERLHISGKTVEKCFIFPYGFNKLNSYMFMLYVPFSLYESGIKDHSINLKNENILNSINKFTEITKEEFIKAAQENCEHVLKYRLSRISDFC